MTSSFHRSVFYPFFVAVVVIQGIHVFEHIVQLVQVYVFGVLDDDALWLLGYVFQFQGTEEWLHLVFNSAFLLALFALAIPIRRRVPDIIPFWAFGVFVAGGLGLESWHMVEHTVIIANVIKNSGCPCPGIGDVALGVSDTQLHFVYNAVAYTALMTPFWFITRGSQETQAYTPAAV